MKCVNHTEADAVTKCVSCGSSICEECRVTSKGEDYCKNCLSKKVEETSKGERSPVLAAILSFIIGGAGQIYNGQIGKGLLILFTSWLVLPWIYGIFDAYATAKKINAGKITAKARPGCVIALVVGIVILFFSVAVLGLLAAIAIPNFVRARDTAMARLCISNLNQSAKAKRMWFIETGGKSTNPTWQDLVPQYLSAMPVCPSGGTYSLGDIDASPACSIGYNDTEWFEDDHVISISAPSSTAPAAGGEPRVRFSGSVTKRPESIKNLDEPEPAQERSDYVKVYLKNGRYFEAMIARETEEVVVFEISGGTFLIEKGDIERIER
ncbi:MAG: hypothetical protein ISS34_01790 [Candidatus Omnitrophica bacterium]|nr:hypothetical protein [Candidatus Omnitrophota bacterium]